MPSQFITVRRGRALPRDVPQRVEQEVDRYVRHALEQVVLEVPLRTTHDRQQQRQHAHVAAAQQPAHRLAPLLVLKRVPLGDRAVERFVQPRLEIDFGDRQRRTRRHRAASVNDGRAACYRADGHERGDRRPKNETSDREGPGRSSGVVSD
jgi:hypothetical protein